MRPPVQVATPSETLSCQPGGGSEIARSMPAGASSRSEVVAWGGRSFGVWKTTTDGTPSSTNGGETVTCAARGGRGERERRAEEPDDEPARVKDP